MEAEKNELEDFLDEQLLQFITDDMPTLLSSSHTHQQNYFDDTDDTEGILLEAIEQFEKASQQTFKSDSCSNSALRQFANPSQERTYSKQCEAKFRKVLIVIQNIVLKCGRNG